ncbi:hypothetical protein S7S_12745 [Isoalcanivorax pacificus W11-5]|uniref:SbsA Ig-like domain-containing protein n=2 Tax=Isoalcanivorax TaxID=3020833 RepID=A0A0B4XPD3_9GAMM|nr:hypothetical protein S7S_12745 [Isoalcanivorax pacificus W11-5]
MKRIIMAACIVSLAACGGDKDDVATEQQQDWESQNQSLVYSFPDNGQEQVPVPSPVVLRFTGPVMETAPAIVLREAGGPVVSDVEMEWVDGKRGLIITPDRKLKPMTEYLVQIPAIELEKGTAAARNLSFTTRGLYEGPKNQVGEASFEVTRMIPDGENYSVLDFSSFRVQFSQPLDKTTVKYGDGPEATVQLVGPGGLVDAHLLISGHYMTVDPKEDLTPGVEYSLNITTGITSTYGETLPGGSFGNPGDTLAVSLKATPQDTTAPGTGERVSMVQDVADTGELSPLTGMPINLVPMASLLLGDETATQASGIIAAELAFVPNFPDATPFRVKRGSLIEGASIEVLINGEVPAGFDSGKVRMDFISDASGYLLPNPYSNADDAPRQVRLFMDVAVSTETPQANGAITQDLLHIELVGTSIVENGQMVINAVGVVEPDVLGSERATGVLSFYMKAYEDQDNPPTPVVDGNPPVVQSWIPGVDAAGFMNTDPVIIQFSKPIDLSGATEGMVIVEENGVPVDAEIEGRGAALIIRPEGGFKNSFQQDLGIVQSYVYKITIKKGLTDVSGNETLQDIPLEFEMPLMITTQENYVWDLDYSTFTPFLNYLGEGDAIVRSPMITAVYPGFPCSVDESLLNLDSGMTGRCKGGIDQVYSRTETPDGGTLINTPDKLPDDILPLQVLPANRPIIAIFTKNIDPGSVRLGGSFLVEKVDASGNPADSVDGNVIVDGRKITFYPTDEWVQGQYYRYVMGSNGNRKSSSAICDGSQSICGEDGLPIQTQLHELTVTEYQGIDLIYQDANLESGGGDPLVQYFKGGVVSQDVIQVLNAPSSDTNANMIHDNNFPREHSGNHALLTVPYAVYSEAEKGAEGQPLVPDACDASEPSCEDPNGLIPPVNSAKLIAAGEAVNPVNPFGKYMIPTVSVGCGFESVLNPSLPIMEPKVCPEAKFTYIASDLITEIGTYDESIGGVGVKIWPGQIMSTAVPMYAPFEGCGGNCVLGLDSGPQVMRMRYSKLDDGCIEDPVSNTSCVRDQPISAVIRNVGGQPFISVDVEVYIDAIDLQSKVTVVGDYMLAPGMADTLTDMVSVPVTLKLEGMVTFNDDGTMNINMENSNEVDVSFGLKLYGEALGFAFPITWTSIKIPEGGSRIRYVSEIIK